MIRVVECGFLVGLGEHRRFVVTGSLADRKSTPVTPITI